MSLPVDIGTLHLEHPVPNGSGTFDAIAARRAFGETVWERFPFSAFVSKTITPEPRSGNPPPRLSETPAGLINSIGLPNRGLEGFLAADLPQLAALPVPLVVSVMATSHDGFARLVRAALERGLYLMTHWNVVMVVPPLTVTVDEAEEGIAVLDDVLSIADDYVTA